MASFVDPSLASQILRESLVSNAAVTAIVGDRVRGSHAVDPDATDPTYPILVLANAGGAAIRGGVVADLTFALTAYSRTSSDEALAAYQAAVAVLGTERLTRTGISATLVVHERTRPVLGWDEPHRAHFAVGRLRVTEFSS